MSFHVQKWPDILNCWSDIPSKKEANKKKEGKNDRKEKGIKRRGKNDGGKNRKIRKKKKGKKGKKKGEVNKTI